MKYGKQFLETLNSPGIPAEWRQQAIEYRKLKKVINRVASELKDLGLTSEVLKDLLQQEAQQQTADAQGTSKLAQDTSRRARRPSRNRSNTVRESTNAEILGHEEEKQEADVHVEAVVGEPWDSSEDDEGDLPSNSKGKGKPRRRARATYELAGTTESPEPRIRIVFSSASSGSESMSDSSTSNLTTALFNRHVGNSSEESSGSAARFTELVDSSEDDGKETTESAHESESVSSQHDERDDDFADAGPQTNKLLQKMYGLVVESDHEIEEAEDWASVGVDVEPKRRTSQETLRSQDVSEHFYTPNGSAAASLRTVDIHEADGDVEADDEGSRIRRPPRQRRHRPRQHRKEIFIPLSTDNEFLTLLAKALASLGNLHVAQKLQFTAAVELLAREVSKVSSPSRPKTDLYIWREIFSLWIEAEIFESERERDRGERPTEEVEKKLNWFVDQVAKRKLAKRMKNKESRAALEKFIQLNVELLEMKKFQLANEEAARKILKKHDKRTALTASRGFPKFIASSSDLFREMEGPDSSSNSRVLALPGFPSLPHILLTTFTSTLLPIIPQLEDYECAICGDVAFKPIRLECGHKFCVRCLVKMQKRGQDACPQCRAPVVLRANATNLDTAMQSYLQLWFPKEVKAKAISNKKEAAQEDLEEMGLGDHKCVVQ